MNMFKYDCSCYSLLALNIIDFDGRCLKYLSNRAPHMEWALMSLQQLGQKCKLKTDRNGVECEIAHHACCFLKNLPASLTLDIETVSSLTKLKYLYFKRKLSTVLRGNIFNDYVSFMKMKLKNCSSHPEGEELVRKFLAVCDIIHPPIELSGEDVEQYEFMAELLNFCFTINIQDSRLVIALLRTTIDRCGIAPFDSFYVRQPLYPTAFLQYVLHHVTNKRFDLGSYCLRNPRTLWEYSRNFSVFNAVSFGNTQRLLTLLQYGFEVFPEIELRRSGHGFTSIGEILPPRYLMVLQMMCSLRSVNLIMVNSANHPNNMLYFATEEQKQCFQLIWRAIPDPYVKHAEMVSAIFAEYFVLAQNAILNPMRYEKHTKFSMMYERCFSDMASGPKEPRTLKHLSRCSTRKELRATWNLPSGIFKLHLPKILHRYLNLEID